MRLLKLSLVSGLSVLAFASLTQAAQSDASVFENGGRHGRCAIRAWRAAEPTDAQKDQAKTFIDAAKAVYEQHKDAITTDRDAVRTAWMAHPIVQADVVNTGKALHDEAVPVMEAARDAAINVINLLTADQRAKFNQKYMQCTGDHHHPHPHPQPTPSPTPEPSPVPTPMPEPSPAPSPAPTN